TRSRRGFASVSLTWLLVLTRYIPRRHGSRLGPCCKGGGKHREGSAPRTVAAIAIDAVVAVARCPPLPGVITATAAGRAGCERRRQHPRAPSRPRCRVRATPRVRAS